MKREYRVRIWTGGSPGVQDVVVPASDLNEAKDRVRAEYGDSVRFVITELDDGGSQQRSIRPYKALVSTGEKSGTIVEVMADSLADARVKLEAEYGEGTVSSLWNEEDAAKPR